MHKINMQIYALNMQLYALIIYRYMQSKIYAKYVKNMQDYAQILVCKKYAKYAMTPLVCQWILTQ